MGKCVLQLQSYQKKKSFKNFCSISLKIVQKKRDKLSAIVVNQVASVQVDEYFQRGSTFKLHWNINPNSRANKL